MIGIDEAHVLLDALGVHDQQINRRQSQPWLDYQGNPDDPKLTENSYCSLITSARAALVAIVEAS